MLHVTLSTGELLPALGMGTWNMGENRLNREGEVRALKTGLDLGLTLIDTAEMYARGGSEEVVAEAVAGRREGVFIVTKVLPQNASAKGTLKACDESLRRLRVDSIDLYLLHWRGSYPLEDTVGAFEKLREQGKIRHWGVSNFDSDDMIELAALPARSHCLANQVLYHLGERGVEWQLIPMCNQQQIAVMAYSPLGQGELLEHAALTQLARKHNVSPAAIALAWTFRQPGVISIPKSSRVDHVRENAAALDVTLDTEDMSRLDKAFPPPHRKTPLGII